LAPVNQGVQKLGCTRSDLGMGDRVLSSSSSCLLTFDRPGIGALLKILFVCLGNICRSPLGEGLMRAHLDRRGLDASGVDSAGTGAWHVGEPPDRRSVAVAKRHGVDLSRQRARQFVAEDFHRFERILAMDQSNYTAMAALCPDPLLREKLELLLSPERGGPADVPDPYYGGASGFDDVYDLVDQACSALADELER
jgi:protein-tyrosine phosphatase